jgi:phage repressor protein C with HTH and peptisase S24 domain
MTDDTRLADNREYLGILSELLAEGRSVNLAIAGNSMSPFLIHGRDQVLLVPLTEQPHVGDIIFYRRTDGSYVLHRLCRVTEKEYIFIGDNQTQTEHGIFRDQLLAKVTAVKRNEKILTPKHPLWRFFSEPWIRLWRLRPLFRFIYFGIKKGGNHETS